MISRSRRMRAYLVWFLLVGGLVPWRQGEYYDGGADPIVISKALLQLLALLIAVAGLRGPWPQGRVGGRSLLLVLLFVGISCIGGLAAGDTIASIVLAVRVILLALTITALLHTISAQTALSSLLTTMGCFGAGAAISGIGLWASTGRLAGAVPPLSANGIALLCVLPALGLLHEFLHTRLNIGQMLSLFGLLVVIIATESRTAIFGLILAALVLLFYIRTIKKSVVLSLLVGAPIFISLLMYTPFVQNLAVREDGGSIQTLNSRTIAWNAVLEIPSDTWERWVGAGLSVKTVAIEGQYWNQQVLDSSWFSGLAQAGVAGVAVMGVWTLLTVHASLTSASLRTFAPAVVVFIMARSILENGLVEASTTFLVFFTISMLAEAPNTVKAHNPSAASSVSFPAEAGSSARYYSIKAPR